jgi:hypothetical protein
VGEVSQLERGEIYSSETGWKDGEGKDFVYGYERLEKLELCQGLWTSLLIEYMRTYKGY